MRSFSSLLLSLLRTIGKSLVYGSVFVLITGVFFTYAAGPNGLFGDYFSRMVGSCVGDGITTGFNSTPASYGTRLCKSFKTFLGENTIYPSGGNVGIGTATPGKKLDVNGDIRASGTNSDIAAGRHVWAQAFYDTNNYFIDPNGTSYMNRLCLGNGSSWDCRNNWAPSTTLRTLITSGASCPGLSSGGFGGCRVIGGRLVCSGGVQSGQVGTKVAGNSFLGQTTTYYICLDGMEVPTGASTYYQDAGGGL